jgi:hypothetical protein
VPWINVLRFIFIITCYTHIIYLCVHFLLPAMWIINQSINRGRRTSGESSFYGRVYTMSLGPIFVALCNLAVYRFRVRCSYITTSDTKLKSQHAYIFLLLTYLVLPPVSMIHFQSLGFSPDCFNLILSLSLSLSLSLYLFDEKPQIQSFFICAQYLFFMFLTFFKCV